MPAAASTIQLDAEPQHFCFEPDACLCNRFDVFTRLRTIPPDLLLAQKCYAILSRGPNKGRDFYDAAFLWGRQVQPNYACLAQKRGIETPRKLREQLLAHCQMLAMAAVAADVRPFLFNPRDERLVMLFPDYVRQVLR